MSVVPTSDDGTVLPDSMFDQWGKTSLLLGDKFGKSLRVVDDLADSDFAVGGVGASRHE